MIAVRTRLCWRTAGDELPPSSITWKVRSGCRIENIAHETAERVRRAIALNLAIAWRIMPMTLLGRETPDLPYEVLAQELKAKVARLTDEYFIAGHCGLLSGGQIGIGCVGFDIRTPNAEE